MSGFTCRCIDFGGNPFTLDHLVQYTTTAVELGFAALAANDHLVFGAPWLDGPTALAAVLGSSGTMTRGHHRGPAVVRGPVPLAKSLAAIDRLSGGRLLVAVGPGSSPADHAAVGLDFSERWTRLDEAVGALRALLGPGREPHAGRWYSTTDIELLPYPVQPGGPPIWLGSWGSEAGLRRVARLADGWLASAYNITPAEFADARGRLADHLVTSQRGHRGAPQCALDDVVLHHRAPRRGGDDTAGAAGAGRPPSRARSSANGSRSAVPTPFVEKLPSSQMPGCNGSTSGRSTTSSASSNCSPNTSCR